MLDLRRPTAWPAAGGEARQRHLRCRRGRRRSTAGAIGYADGRARPATCVAKRRRRRGVRRADRRGRRQAVVELPVVGAGRVDFAIEVNRHTRSRASTRSSWSATTSAASSTTTRDGRRVKAFMEYVISEDGQQAAADDAGYAPISGRPARAGPGRGRRHHAPAAGDSGLPTRQRRGGTGATPRAVGDVRHRRTGQRPRQHRAAGTGAAATASDDLDAAPARRSDRAGPRRRPSATASSPAPPRRPASILLVIMAGGRGLPDLRGDPGAHRARRGHPDHEAGPDEAQPLRHRARCSSARCSRVIALSSPPRSPSASPCSSPTTRPGGCATASATSSTCWPPSPASSSASGAWPSSCAPGSSALLRLARRSTSSCIPFFAGTGPSATGRTMLPPASCWRS